MAEEKDVLKYQLDISDVEVKTARIKALTEEITAKRVAGEDVLGLEVQLGREIDALGKLGQAQQKAAGSAGDLVKEKDKLANVVSLLGGRFGGMVGQLGSVVELLMQAGPAAAGFAVALAGVTAVVAGVTRLNEQLEIANKRLKDLQESYETLAERQRGPLEQIGDTLRGLGALEQGRPEEVYKFMLKMGELGIKPELALPVAAVAQIAEATPQEAALVVLASTAPGGQVPQTPEELKAVVARLTSEAAGGEVRQQLAAMRDAPEGRRAIAQVALARRLYAKAGDQLRALFDPDQDALLRELSGQGAQRREVAGAGGASGE